ncbi:YjaG family protein [Marinobacterium sp. AK62]|uniref:YjaG family protein n=1 Tax=Marinobacterium alkalitolerans TaxID=1542925 RepID=A0ABS3Z831_9GAMM|nr:YjaG family protein [Marinobacterium alkalitolerans]MBP0047159.1 YjaG family protein [Marinobacterium alkalitolerans]
MTELLNLEPELETFEPWQLTAFSAAMTERMFPNFALFARLVEFGDAAKLRQILDGVWDSLTGRAGKMNFEVQQEAVEANMPDLEEYDMYGALPALDAVVALNATLSCILEKDVSAAASIGQLSRECVATFLEVTEGDDQLSDEELVKLINTHDLMLAEDDFREEVIERVRGQKHPNAEWVASLRELARNEGVSNIGISDDD